MPQDRAMSGLDKPRLILTLGLVALAVLACLDAWLDIARIVRVDEEASHILLVPLVFARIAWVRRGMLKDWAPRASLWGVAIALLGIVFWLVGNIKAMQVVWHFGAVLALFGAFVSVNGLDIARRLWPAFVVLVFLMPLPGMIRQPIGLFLQNASAQATEFVILALGFDLVRHGNLLIINEYTIGVAEACNGMRMVSMLILIVFAFVFSEQVRPWVRVTLILMAVPLAIFCNILRLVPTVLAYGFFSPDFADQLHDWLGWGLAFASYFGLMGLLWLMRWLLLPVDPSSKPRVGPGWVYRQRRAKRDAVMAQGQAAVSSARSMALPAIGAMALFGGAFAAGWSLPDGSGAEAYHARIRVVAEDLPREVGVWSSVDTELPEAAVALLRPNVLISRRYENASTNRSFSLLVVQCADARDMEGHYPPNCYPSAGWTSSGRRPVELQIGAMQADSVDYGFVRTTEDGLEAIEVVNLIMLPGDGFVTSIGSIRRLSGTVSDRYFGAAQVQFVFYGQWDREDRLDVVEQVGQTLEPLIGVILDKPGD